MKYVGIDYGSKRVGIAVSDEDGAIAFPRSVLENGPALLSEASKCIMAEHARHIVMGDTRTVSGESNPVTAEAEVFAKALEKETGIPVSWVREAWSSIEVSRHAPEGRGHDDAAAAAFILQRFLDMRSRR